MMKKYDRQDQRLMATWAADCAERVLPFFEKSYPQDDRPRKAIETCRSWVRTGVFKMVEIRGASLAAHAAARQAKENPAASFAARAAGQAVATAHVPQHAFGGAYYALKAIAASDPVHAEPKVTKEHNWQARHIPLQLRQEVLKRVIVQKRGEGIFINVQKDKDF
jgi:immunity protein 5 of polymorphic toxin system